VNAQCVNEVKRLSQGTSRLAPKPVNLEYAVDLHEQPLEQQNHPTSIIAPRLFPDPTLLVRTGQRISIDVQVVCIASFRPMATEEKAENISVDTSKSHLLMISVLRASLVPTP